MFSSSRTLYLLLLSGMALTACDGAIVAERTTRFFYEMVQGKEVNLKDHSYAAADYMQHQIRSYVKKSDLIKVVPLFSPISTEELEMSKSGEKQNEDALEQPELTTLIPFQVGSRLAQLGYNVDTSQVMPSATNEVQTQRPAYILSGSFDHQPFELHPYRDVNVSLSVADTASGRIIATFDYVLPKNLNVTMLSHTFKMPNKGEEHIDDVSKDGAKDQMPYPTK